MLLLKPKKGKKKKKKEKVRNKMVKTEEEWKQGPFTFALAEKKVHNWEN